MIHVRIAVAMTLLSACDESPAPRAAAPQNTAAEQADREMIAKIAALSPEQVEIMLFRAIRDARFKCQEVTISRRIADQNGRPAWSAQCDRTGGKFLLVLSPKGMMNVTPGEAFNK